MTISYVYVVVVVVVVVVVGGGGGGGGGGGVTAVVFLAHTITTIMSITICILFWLGFYRNMILMLISY